MPGSGSLKPGPGQHYFLYQPLKWKGWENHPFTLATYEIIENCEGLITPEAGTEGNTHKEASTEKDVDVVPLGPSPSSSSGVAAVASPNQQADFKDAVGQQKLTFFIRPFGSWTRRLREECDKSPSRIFNPRIIIEGPYVERSTLHAYDNVVFVVGGTGISGALPYMQEYVKKTAENATAVETGGKLATRTRDITQICLGDQAGCHDPQRCGARVEAHAWPG